MVYGHGHVSIPSFLWLTIVNDKERDHHLKYRHQEKTIYLSSSNRWVKEIALFYHKLKYVDSVICMFYHCFSFLFHIYIYTYVSIITCLSWLFIKIDDFVMKALCLDNVSICRVSQVNVRCYHWIGCIFGEFSFSVCFICSLISFFILNTYIYIARDWYMYQFLANSYRTDIKQSNTDVCLLFT